MDLLVIGGTRFSGRALVEQAIAAGHDVTVFHRTPTDLVPRGRTRPRAIESKGSTR